MRSVAMRASRWQPRGKENNVEDDTVSRSGTESTNTPRGSSSWASEDDERHFNCREGRKAGQELLGMLAQRPGSRADKGWQQDAPPPPPPPPPLPAPKTRLQSKASLFVPKALAGAQGEGVQHISGKECLRTLIQNTLGNQMLDFFMVDQQSYTGECYTNI